MITAFGRHEVGRLVDLDRAGHYIEWPSPRVVLPAAGRSPSVEFGPVL